MNKMDFCAAVEAAVYHQFGEQDGGDLCWNLMDMGIIDNDASVNQAARIVAQHLQQA